ncbi:MAG: tRNA (N(6)-L-threonylcarbamoyladenosine(37)-C(2))-methylthiotransferase MtaB [Proteobacteria bacterium]|nr:tRNA (N(6)-L-threonylcarbamoyladenosine(37)-C(2))-methylthiotransferase MtaB [Pseudomonadota bacterium]
MQKKLKKFTITTLGCKVNQAESESIAQELITSDWSAVKNSDRAEVCIVNTCTVTQKASMQSRQAVRKAIRSNPNACIIVTGCYAQTAPQEINKIDGVDYIVGHDKKLSISRLIRSKGDDASDNQVSSFNDIGKKRRFQLMPTATSAPRTRPFLKIQDGCDAFCTYCIVPYARGRSRSMPLDNVLQSIEQLARAGYHEVVLTGIHLGAYGQDLTPATNLVQLMERIADGKSITRVRISSIEPFELTAEVIQRVAESDIFCKHFHIPLQSGDDGILKKMGRPYSRRDFYDLISSIHRKMPDAAIGVDTLIGFPGESEAAFDNTYELMADLPVSYLHVFPFSSRPGTVADKLPNKLNPAVIKDRCKRMRELGHQLREKFYGKFIGQKTKILIEAKREGSTGLLKGISSNYLPILIDADDECKNKLVEVRIEKLERNQLFGVLCK